MLIYDYGASGKLNVHMPHISIYHIIPKKTIKMHTSYYLSYIFATIYQTI